MAMSVDGRCFREDGFPKRKLISQREFLVKKEASGLKMGLLRMIDVLKGFLDKIRAVWVENGAYMSINVLKGLGIEKGCLGRK